MKNLSVTIALAVLLAAAVLGIASYAQLKQEKTELISVGERIESVREQITQAKQQLADLEKQNELLKQNIAESENQINAYNNQLSELKGIKDEVFSKLQNERMQLASLNEELDSLNKERDALKRKADEITSRQKLADDEIIKLTEVKKGLEEDIKEYIQPEKGVELDKIVVKLSKTPKGSILEANDRYGFAIVNIGSDDGVIVGDIFDVYRDDKLISKVIVDKIFEDMSSVVAAEGFTDIELMPSDKVSLAK